MPITSLNDPIAGSELKKIILARVAEKLDHDCTLTDDIAYAGFEMTFDIVIRYKRSITDRTLIWGVERGGEMGKQEGTEIVTATVHDSYESDSPNQAREDHNLPIPVMIPGPQGPVKERIHIPEAQKRGPGRPPKQQ